VVEKEAVFVLFGEYKHNVDGKGRVFIPAKLRETLGESFMLCKGIEGKRCLCIYPMDEWNKLDETIRQLPTVKASAVRHFLYAGAASLECDGQGRALLPASLREYAELTGEISILGMSTHLELWNNDAWSKENGEYSPEAIGEMVAELNF
jgi:MraZ protein